MKRSAMFTYTTLLQLLLMFERCRGEEPLLKIEDSFPVGKCDQPTSEGDIVTWWAAGNLENQGKAFDIAEYETKIGYGEVPEGIDQGLQGLCVGDKRTLIIQPLLAYGEEGLDDRVPANETVIYDVEVLNITRKVKNVKKGTEKRHGLLFNKMFHFEDLDKVENCALKVQGGDRIEWNYIGTLTNGIGFDTGTFDARIDRGDVIKGVDEGMKGLCVGGRRRMIMHHSYGYGPEGTDGIPRYSNLIFEVHLLSLDRPGVGSQDADMYKLSALVSKENPVKTIDSLKTGECKDKVVKGTVLKWKGTGYLLTGKIFDDYEVTITIGDRTTLPALENSLLGLCKGDGRSIIVHPDAAFGDKGIQDMVPMHATVIYDVSVVHLINREEL